MLRGFTDSRGVEWRVWEVLPTTWGDATSSRSFTRSSFNDSVFANGWLCFESSQEKRRLAPIPAGWEQNEDARLEELCYSAAPVQSRRGSLSGAA